MDDNKQQKTTQEGSKLWDTADVMEYTGWGRPHVSKLCTRGLLPHIKGRPTKFIESEVKKALVQMQQGGVYGRKKTSTKPKRTKLPATNVAHSIQ